MLDALPTLLSSIHNSRTKAVVIITGGGTGFFDLLLSRGNGSKTLLAGYIPYTMGEVDTLLGYKPEKYASLETARALAMVAYQKAVKLDKDSPVVGIACSASLQGVPDEREGRDHNIYFSVQCGRSTWTAHVPISAKNRYPGRNPLEQRLAEEEYVSNMLIKILANVCIEWKITEKVSPFSSDIIKSVMQPDQAGGWLYNRSKPGYVYHGKKVIFSENDIERHGDFTNAVIIPGSFNPLHEGHIELAEYLEKNTTLDVGFEICMNNVDKPPLDSITCYERLDQFTSRFLDKDKCNIVNGRQDTEGLKYRVIFSNLPTFKEKSRIFKGARFAVGYDTAVRILDPKYAGPIDEVLETFRENGTYFYMFPREVPGMTQEEVEALIVRLPGEIVRQPMKYRGVSSSKIRKQEQQ